MANPISICKGTFVAQQDSVRCRQWHLEFRFWELTMDVNRLLKFDNAHPILTKVKSSLANLGYPQLNQIKCEQEGSTVVLKGELASFYMSQLAQTTVSKVPGVVRVENRVTVGPVV